MPGKLITRGLPPVLLLGLLACSGRPAVQTVPEQRPTPEVTLPLDRLIVLEYWGAPPDDTTLTVGTTGERTVVLRHAPPDLTIYAELILPDSVLAGLGDSVRLTLTTRPGTYGVTIESSPAFRSGAVLRFKYPVHFAAPAAALQRYGSVAQYERALAIGRAVENGAWHLQASTRPYPDNLETTIEGPGSYLVAAPR